MSNITLTIPERTQDGPQTKDYTAKKEKPREFVMANFRAECEKAQEEEARGEKDRAIDAYKTALKMNQVPYGMVAYVYSNIGRLFQELRSFPRALEYHQNHLTIAQETDDDSMRIIANTNIGTTYYCMRQYEEAQAYHEVALDLATKKDDARGQMRAFANLGNAWGASGNFKEAAMYHKEQLLMARKIGDKEAEGRASFNLENDHNSMNEYNEASTYRTKKMELLSMATLEGGVEKLKLNKGLGDTKITEEVYSGWVFKQHGKDNKKGVEMELGPKGKPVKKRYFMVLSRGQLVYFDNVRSSAKPRRVIEVANILAANELSEDMAKAMHRKGWPSGVTARTFAVKVHPKDGSTTSRVFYFTTDDEASKDEWVEVIAKAQTDKDKFSSFRKKRGAGGGAGLDFLRKFADDEDSAAAGPAPADLGDLGDRIGDENPFDTRSAAAVVNPLFRSDSVSSRGRANTYEMNAQQDPSNVIVNPNYHDFEQATEETAFSSFGIAAPTSPDEDPDRIKWYGAVKMTKKTEWPPTEKEMAAMTQKVVGKPRTMYDKQLLKMDFTFLGLDINTIPANPEGDPRTIHQHETAHIISWHAFDNALALAIDESTNTQTFCKLYVYDCQTAAKATELEELVSGLESEGDGDIGGPALFASQASVELMSFGVGQGDTRGTPKDGDSDDEYLELADESEIAIEHGTTLDSIVTTRESRQKKKRGSITLSETPHEAGSTTDDHGAGPADFPSGDGAADPSNPFGGAARPTGSSDGGMTEQELDDRKSDGDSDEPDDNEMAAEEKEIAKMQSNRDKDRKKRGSSMRVAKEVSEMI